MRDRSAREERERELCGGEVEVTVAVGGRHAEAKQSLIYARGVAYY